jgi:hypothetical protein
VALHAEEAVAQPAARSGWAAAEEAAAQHGEEAAALPAEEAVELQAVEAVVLLVAEAAAVQVLAAQQAVEEAGRVARWWFRRATRALPYRTTAAGIATS